MTTAASVICQRRRPRHRWRRLSCRSADFSRHLAGSMVGVPSPVARAVPGGFVECNRCPAVELAAVASLPAAAGDGPAKHTQSPAASINAERPLPLIFIWQSPHLPVPGRNETSPRVHSAAKKGNLRANPPKAGQPHVPAPGISRSPLHEIPEKNAAGASRADQCYQPASAKFEAAIPEGTRRLHRTLRFDHDSVIEASKA